MGYRFDGFFAAADEAVLRAALARWPQCRGRMVDEPFAGVGVACPGFRDVHGDEAYEAVLTQIAEVEEGLPAWSREHPGVTFVYIAADCFGGVCSYEGYACRDGQVLHREEDAGRTRAESLAALTRLLGWLGVRSADGFFAPLQRGFFG